MNNLLHQARAWREEADKLLQESNLTSIISKYGTIVYAGAYDYDLMLTPDIDMYIVSENSSKQQSKALLNDLIDQSYWNGHLFYDWTRFRHKDHFPKAYYVGLKTIFHNHRWKIDIWLLTSEQAKALDHSWIKANLNEEIMHAILKFKQARNQSKFEASGLDICDAVMRHNVRTVKQMKDYLAKKDEEVR